MKKLLILGVVVVSSMFANAAYLYWTIDTSYTFQNTGATYNWTTDSGANKFQTGKVNVLDSSGKIVASSDEYVAKSTTPTSERYTFDISQWSGANYSYSIELLAYNSTSESWGQVGATNAKSYQELVTDGVILTGAEETLTPPTLAVVQAAWLGAGANAPEPTSAMLMLLGVAGLALRRKQRKTE